MLTEILYPSLAPFWTSTEKSRTSPSLNTGCVKSSSEPGIVKVLPSKPSTSYSTHMWTSTAARDVVPVFFTFPRTKVIENDAGAG